MKCPQCDSITINGLYCHEEGCPEAWRDYTLDCLWCGCAFSPSERQQRFCDDNCASCYYGEPLSIED